MEEVRLMSDPSITEIVSNVLRANMKRGVTYRYYGPNGEHKRMMVHRWSASKIRGAKPYATEGIMKNNSLLSALMKRGK